MVSALQSHQEDSDDSSLSSVEGDTHFQFACAAIATTNPNVAMALKSHKARDLDLKSVWLLDNQSTFDLCCNPDFAHKRRDAKRAMHMSSNGGGLWISKECKVCYCRYVDKIGSNTILLLSSIPYHWIGTMGRCQVMSPTTSGFGSLSEQ